LANHSFPSAAGVRRSGVARMRSLRLRIVGVGASSLCGWVRFGAHARTLCCAETRTRAVCGTMLCAGPLKRSRSADCDGTTTPRIAWPAAVCSREVPSPCLISRRTCRHRGDDRSSSEVVSRWLRADPSPAVGDAVSRLSGQVCVTRARPDSRANCARGRVRTRQDPCSRSQRA
jgi:hypothetical protein